jgi:hypothetical protein
MDRYREAGRLLDNQGGPASAVAFKEIVCPRNTERIGLPRLAGI